MAKSKNTVDMDVNVKGKGVQKTTVQMKKLGDQTKKVSKSTAEANRNWKGASNQSSGASKNFSKMSQGMGGIVGAYATLAANIFAIGAAFRFLESAGDLAKLKEGQILYASATGTALRSLTNDIIAATDAQITFTNASQAAAIGKAAGLTNDQLTKLGQGAKDVSIILGRDVTDSFNRLVRGVTKAEPELLDELGIILRLTDASEKYGAMIGKNANDLTQYEKSQAVTVEVLDQLENKYGRIMAVMEPEGNQFTQLGVAFDNIVNDIKEVAQVVAGPIAAVLTKTPALAVGMLATLGASLVKTSLASWATRASERAEVLATKYKAAKHELVQLQSAEKNVTQVSGGLKHAKGLAGAASGIAGTPQGERLKSSKAFQNLMKGDFAKLNRQQLMGMKKMVEGMKGLDAKMVADFKAAMIAMLADVKKTTKQQEAEWKKNSIHFKITIAGMRTWFQAQMAGMAQFASAAGAVMATAMSWLTGISLAITLVTTAVQYLGKRQKEIDEFGKEVTVAGEKVTALNEEFSKFHEVQEIITEDGENMLSYFESLGNRIGQLSMDMQRVILESATEGLQEALDPALFDQQLAGIEKRLKESTTKWYKWINLGFIGGGSGRGMGSGFDLKEENERLDSYKAALEELRSDPKFKAEQDETDLMIGGSPYANKELMRAAGASEEFIQTMIDGGMWGENYSDIIQELNFEIARIGDIVGPSNAAIMGLNGNLIGFLEGSEDIAQVELGKYYRDLLKEVGTSSHVFADAKNPVMDFLQVLQSLEDITTMKYTEGVDKGKVIWEQSITEAEKMKAVIEEISIAQNASSAWSASIASANRMAIENAQETDKLLLNIQARSTEGRMEDTLENELLERLRGSEAATEEKLEEMGRDGALAYAKGLAAGEGVFMPTGLNKEAAKDYLDRNKQLIRQIELFDILDRRKDDAAARTLQQSISEKQALLGTTKLVGKRIKLEETLAKNRNKSLAIQDERFEINAKIAEVREETGKLDYIGEEQQTRRLAQLDLELELLVAQSAETERKLDLTMQIADAAKQALESGLTKGFSSFLKGEEASFTAVLQNIAQGVWDAVADTVAKQMSESVMTLIFGETETEADRMKLALEEGGETVRTSWEELFKWFNDEIRGNTTQFMPDGQTPDLRPTSSTLFESFDTQANRDIFAMMNSGPTYAPTQTEDDYPVGSTIAAPVAQSIDALSQAILDNYPDEQAALALIAAGLEPFQTEGSGFVHDVDLTAAVREMQRGLTAAGDADAERVAGIFEVETTETLAAAKVKTAAEAPGGAINKQLGQEETQQRRFWRAFGKGEFTTSPSKMTGSAAPGSTDAFGNPIGKPIEEKGGFMSKLTGFFSADSPWMTKLGDFFGGEGGFLKSLGGLFGGLGDIFGQLFGGGGGADGFMSILTTMFTGAQGGIAPGGFRKFARGGIATSPTLGMIGEGRHNEAVVPLPNGRAIPVDMRSNAQNNNVTVNVSSDGQTQTEGQDSDGLGQAIAKAVQEELQNQKRSGGILNRYGTA